MEVGCKVPSIPQQLHLLTLRGVHVKELKITRWNIETKWLIVTWPEYMGDTVKQEIQAPSLPERDKCRICYSSEWTQQREAFFPGIKASWNQKGVGLPFFIELPSTILFVSWLLFVFVPGLMLRGEFLSPFPSEFDAEEVNADSFYTLLAFPLWTFWYTLLIRDQK